MSRPSTRKESEADHARHFFDAPRRARRHRGDRRRVDTCRCPAQAALQDRDLNGDTVVDAFYDTDLDITWLRDANVNGAMDWWTAAAWANSYSIGGYSDWRLPASDACLGYNCSGSEMGHLWYVELGNLAGGPMSNVAKFQNVQVASYYWSGTEYAADPSRVYAMLNSIGEQLANPKSPPYTYAMAVRPGDVAPVPEPQTCALLLAGLIGLALAVRRSRR